LAPLNLANGISGWKALIEVRGIKYRLPQKISKIFPDLLPEFQARYLVDDDELAMDTGIVRRAREAIGRNTISYGKCSKSATMFMTSFPTALTPY